MTSHDYVFTIRTNYDVYTFSAQLFIKGYECNQPLNFLRQFVNAAIKVTEVIDYHNYVIVAEQ